MNRLHPIGPTFAGLAFLLATLAGTNLTAQAGMFPTVNYAGDADNSGAVDLADAALALQGLYGSATSSQLSPLVLLDPTPGLNLRDLMLLGQSAFGWRDIFPRPDLLEITPVDDHTLPGIAYDLEFAVSSTDPAATMTDALTANFSISAAHGSTLGASEVNALGNTITVPINTLNTSAPPEVDNVLVTLRIDLLSSGALPVVWEQVFSIAHLTVGAATCGDTNSDPGEQCDDGANGDNCDGCTDACILTSSLFCGDNQTMCGEECDDGGESAACDTDCTWASCGDGTLNPTAGEQCDDFPHDPPLLGGFAAGGAGTVTRLEAIGDTLYAARSDGVEKFDRTSMPPAALAVSDTAIAANALAVSEERILTLELVGSHVNAHLTVWEDLGPSIAFRAEQALALPPFRVTYQGLSLADDRAYAFLNDTVYVIDISDLATPAPLDSFSVGQTMTAAVVRERFGYLATMSPAKSFRVVDLADPLHPTLDAIPLTAANGVFQIDLDGDRAYLAADDQGIVEVDVSDPLNLAATRSFSAGGNYVSVDAMGERIYALTTNALHIFDRSDETRLPVGIYPLTGGATKQVLATPDELLVMDYGEPVLVLEIAEACTTDCLLPACGDGVLGAGEGCDADNRNYPCDEATCTLQTCGNGILDVPEECDHGTWNNDALSDACRTGCLTAFCGDGVIDTGEICDEGAQNGTPGFCLADCSGF